MDINTRNFLRVSAIGLGLLDAGNLLAEDRLLLAEQARQTLRQQAGKDSAAEPDGFRNTLQERMRAMSQEEQKLMRDLSYNGREQAAQEQARIQTRMREEAGQANRYGRGYESRQSQTGPGGTGAGGAAGMGAQGSGIGGGRGRGR